MTLKRRDGSGALPPVSFLFRSGEPALECRTTIATSSAAGFDRLPADQARFR
jgi:hypothetical protein